MQFNIKEVTAKDLDDIKNITDKAEDLQQNEERYSKAYLEQLILDPQAVFLKAMKSGGVIGVVLGEFDSEQDWADLLGLFVKDEFTKRGVEMRLLAEFENVLFEKKISTYSVFSAPKNVGFFQDQGLKKRKEYVSMEKKLL